MNADLLLARIAEALARHHIEAILISNPAIEGAASTVDLTFSVRKTAATVGKLKRLAKELRAVLMKVVYPASGSFRIMRDEDGLQLDFLTNPNGIGSFEALRAGARTVRLGQTQWKLASFVAVNRRQNTPAELAHVPSVCGGARREKLEALKKESDLAEREQIRRLLALPMEKRTNFLRKRIGFRMSAI